MTVTYETPSASNCLKLPSFLENERDMFEGASILGSLRGSTESALGGTPRDGQQRTDDLMSAPSFLLAAFAPRTPVGGGSNEALHCFVGHQARAVGSTRSEDQASDLPVFVRRNSNRPRRSSSLSQAGRSFGIDAMSSSLMGRPFADASQGLLLRPHTATSRSGSCEPPVWGSRTVSRDNFLDLLAAEPAPPVPILLPVTMVAATTATTATVAVVATEEQPEQQPPAGVNQEEAAPKRPHRAAAVKAASRVAEAEAEDDDDDESGSEPEAAARAVKRKPASKASTSRSRKRQRDESGRSGLHVRDRPDMQKKARDGQEHWLTQVKMVRCRWQERREWEREPQYKTQVETCAAQQIKSQHECLLRTLQMAATDGLIEPLPFAVCGPESFLGWTGFRVVMRHAQDFRSRIDSLFPAPLKENTLHTSFRKAGLVPDKWSSGWLGLTPFKFSNDKRVAYAPTQAAAAAARGQV